MRWEGMTRFQNCDPSLSVSSSAVEPLCRKRVRTDMPMHTQTHTNTHTQSHKQNDLSVPDTQPLTLSPLDRYKLAILKAPRKLSVAPPAAASSSLSATCARANTSSRSCARYYPLRPVVPIISNSFTDCCKSSRAYAAS